MSNKEQLILKDLDNYVFPEINELLEIFNEYFNRKSETSDSNSNYDSLILQQKNIQCYNFLSFVIIFLHLKN